MKFNVDPTVAVLVCVGAGMLMGAWQGWWVTKMKVSSFIVTLAGMLYFRGISMIATNGATVAPLPRALKQIATGFLPPVESIALIASGFGLFAGFNILELRRGIALGVVSAPRGELTRALLPALVFSAAAVWLASSKGVPYLIVLVAVCAIAADVLMRRTRYGAQLYAIGGNPEAARLSGINVDRMIFINFVIPGLGYAITGVALTARVSGAIAGSCEFLGEECVDRLDGANLAALDATQGDVCRLLEIFSQPPNVRRNVHRLDIGQLVVSSRKSHQAKNRRQACRYASRVLLLSMVTAKNSKNRHHLFAGGGDDRRHDSSGRPPMRRTEASVGVAKFRLGIASSLGSRM